VGNSTCQRCEFAG